MKTIVYLGPSLPIHKSQELLPEAVYLPPIRNADLISDIDVHNPTHILIIDGVFGANMSVWHKEITYALLKGIKVFGASSMGALRAAELAQVGMIGVGKIFHWYNEGVIERDDYVACLYHQNPLGDYVYDTWPYVNTLAESLDNGTEPVFAHWLSSVPPSAGQRIDQKALDAIELLTTFPSYQQESAPNLTLSVLTPLFNAMLEREKRVMIDQVPVALQHIDSYVMLHSPDHYQIQYDSKNRALALVLCDILGVTLKESDLDDESRRFLVRLGITTEDQLSAWLQANAMSMPEFQRLVIQNARIYALHKSLTSTMMARRHTRTTLDYLRSHDQLRLWIEDCVDTERWLVDRNNEEGVLIDLSESLHELILTHIEDSAISIDCPLDEFVRYSGLGTQEDLRVCLNRYAFARKAKARSGLE